MRRPELKHLPYVLVIPDHGRLIITAVSAEAEKLGIETGMRAADAKAIVPGLEVIDDQPGRNAKLLKALGEWCIRYSPVVAVDGADGLVMNISGCAHLWGGEREYLKEIVSRFKSKGYTVRCAIADTAGAAWAISRYGRVTPVIPAGEQANALLTLPPAALRLEENILQRLRKLGFYQIKSFIGMPRSVLRRRFGESLLLRLGQALGSEDEGIVPLQKPVVYEERLPCLEPIKTKTGIEIAIRRLLEQLCLRLRQDGKGLRTAVFRGYRIDGKLEQVEIGTNRPTHSVGHLFKLLELKIASITPALGIELFTLEAAKVEDVQLTQEALWAGKPGLDDQSITEFLDRAAGKVGAGKIHRYLPQQHYWPERAMKNAAIQEKRLNNWRIDKPRPTQLLPKPEPVEVSAPVPDYPPMLFRYRGGVHHIKKADGPERIEREWWLDEGEHRDYYQVEDEQGQRYWLFRSGHYVGNKPYQWFIHGFFA
ncbi:Y-family DNA polymerase [Mucilaginibacter sp. NFX135]|uniref:Y-family DNA polymerase n=1 Tax=Mucilaginibacter sp. NFX135 TaxID=3402687 RepID=UPI003AFA3D65